MGAPDTVWWRERWMDAVWSSDLKPLQRLVAAVYAAHAGPERVAWVTLGRLCDRSGMSRDAANRAVRELVAQGWLTVSEKARQHRATRYALTVPSSTGDVPLSSTPDVPLAESSSTSPDTSSTSPDTSSTGDVPDLSSERTSTSISSSPHARTLAALLGWTESDGRLRHLDDFLSANAVRSPKHWLTTCHRNGDLEHSYLAFVRDQHAVELRAADPYWASMPASNEGWANAGRSQALRSVGDCPDCDSLGFVQLEGNNVARCTHPSLGATA